MAREGLEFEPEEERAVQSKAAQSRQELIHSPSAVSRTTGDNPLDIIQHRVATAETPDEAGKWLKVRREYLAQNEATNDKQHARRMAVINAYVKVGGIIGLFASGVTLAFHHATGVAGLFVIGAGICLVDLNAGKAVLGSLGNLFGGKKDAKDD